MILLVTPSSKVQASVEALQQATDQQIKVSSNLRHAVADLRAQEFAAVVIDQGLVDAEPAEADALLQHIGTAIPVQINFAICGVERVSREVRGALCRRKREALLARQEAEQAFRSELRGEVTALLLSCEMALEIANLPSAAANKLRTIHELAREMKTKLGITTTA